MAIMEKKEDYTMSSLPNTSMIVAQQTGVTGKETIVRSPEQMLGLPSKKAVPDTVIYGHDSKGGETAKVLTRTTEYTDEYGNVGYQTEMFKKVYSHGGWAKVWLTDLLMALGMINNSKQMDVVFYVLENVKLSENLFIGTIREIADKVGVNKNTVNTAIKKMIEANIITKKMNGVYYVNPAFILQGSDGKQRKLTILYEEAKETDLQSMIEADE